MKYDWSTFTQKINIKAPVEDVYRAWTTTHHLEQWLVRQAVFKDDKKKLKSLNDPIHNGDIYEWLWHGHADKHVDKGTVLYANGHDKLQFSFTKGGIVTVQIGEVMGETIVMLTQEKIPTDEHGKVTYHIGGLTGWTFYLCNLKSYMEGGIDLRNKNTLFANVVNA